MAETDGAAADSAAAQEPKEPAAVAEQRRTRFRRINWRGAVAYGVLPALVLVLGVAAGAAKYIVGSARADEAARIEALQAAKDGSVAILSYKAETAARQLADAGNRLTGQFRSSYLALTRDVVIPGAEQKRISAAATVPAAAVVSADGGRAVVLASIDQTVVVGTGAPTDTASSVRVTLDKVDGTWLISGFDPV
jgi:Mce-associated membrane protein